MTKNKKLRHNEYYNLQKVFDKLYADSQKGRKFDNLTEIISSPENIRLAYRNIKRNSGSNTYGTDKCTIEDIKSVPTDNEFIQISDDLEALKLEGHPTAAGMRFIADQVEAFLK